MNIPEQFLRPFPEPKDVFASQIEEHSKHFLPICSLDMRFLEPNSEELWIHFVQPAGIFDGCVGENTPEYHDEYNFDDSICFDVDGNGKYTFNGDWRFFEINHYDSSTIHQKAQELADERKISLEKALGMYQEIFLDFENTYKINHLVYNIIKAYYQKYHQFPGYKYDLTDESTEDLKDIDKYVQLLRSREEDEATYYESQEAEFIGGLHSDIDDDMHEEGYDSIDDYLNENDELGNLQGIPRDKNGKTFKYIGWLSGYNFQAYGCDELHLFFNRNEKKAVIRLVYS